MTRLNFFFCRVIFIFARVFLNFYPRALKFNLIKNYLISYYFKYEIRIP